MYTLDETINKACELGVKKVKRSLKSQIVLSFIAGAMIAFGYMAYVRSVSLLGEGMGTVVGASVFPVGLIIILFAGGELITGNMTIVSIAYFNKRVTLGQCLKNWMIITFGNIIGALFVAFFFTYFLGNVSPEVVANIAHHKINASPMQIFVSGIGCNWFVGLSVWLFIMVKDTGAKMFAVWFPIMVFVLLGFQHSVANLYILGAAVLNTSVTLFDFVYNFVIVYLGNIVGGAFFVGFLYTYIRDKS
ncbi:formate-nitrite transporter [Erysipelothrix larvae]|uniref:Formate-nitrite transporter n=1 Tax=Erysipelothrix larvae TaxID=1514105 RepID=A0A0X8H1U2_9FIRM|nr:formate/nitrite transporter family protein [Erysipelothrix larvae]AMC94522.1 formate-nitrite transporter [Erysipelothrix larvae]